MENNKLLQTMYLLIRAYKGFQGQKYPREVTPHMIQASHHYRETFRVYANRGVDL
jgi:hypothetical protein